MTDNIESNFLIIGWVKEKVSLLNINCLVKPIPDFDKFIGSVYFEHELYESYKKRNVIVDNWLNNLLIKIINIGENEKKLFGISQLPKHKIA